MAGTIPRVPKRTRKLLVLMAVALAIAWSFGIFRESLVVILLVVIGSLGWRSISRRRRTRAGEDESSRAAGPRLNLVEMMTLVALLLLLTIIVLPAIRRARLSLPIKMRADVTYAARIYVGAAHGETWQRGIALHEEIRFPTATASEAEGVLARFTEGAALDVDVAAMPSTRPSTDEQAYPHLTKAMDDLGWRFDGVHQGADPVFAREGDHVVELSRWKVSNLYDSPPAPLTVGERVRLLFTGTVTAEAPQYTVAAIDPQSGKSPIKAKNVDRFQGAWDSPDAARTSGGGPSVGIKFVHPWLQNAIGCWVLESFWRSLLSFAGSIAGIAAAIFRDELSNAIRRVVGRRKQAAADQRPAPPEASDNKSPPGNFLG